MSTKLTAKQIIEVLIKNEVTPSEFAFNDYADIEEIGETKEVEQVGGEGEGER